MGFRDAVDRYLRRAAQELLPLAVLPGAVDGWQLSAPIRVDAARGPLWLAGVLPLDLFGKARTAWKVGVFASLPP